jgi:Ca2+-binding RTX toxin-like protein
MKIALMSLVVVAVAAVPGVASASTISVDSGVTQFHAAPGEVNKLDLVAETISSATFADAGAPLTAGSGCTAVAAGVSCPPGAIEVTLGDGADAAFVNQFLGSATTVDGGSGNDDIFAGSAGTTAITGGNGNDTLIASTNSNSTVEGGSGDDKLAGRSGADQLSGGPGNDLLAERPSRSFLPLSGDAGDDRIVNTGARGPSDGGAGNDLLINGPDISGGSGNDRILKSEGGGRIRAGSGHDLISAADGTGLGTDISCGDGFDVVWADPEDSVASDCEIRFGGPAPALPGAAQATTDAAALLMHQPSVS